MTGLSPGISGSRSPSLLWKRSGGAGDACPRPCNRGCAPLECTVKLPKSIEVLIGDKVEEREFLEVRSSKAVSARRWELSVDSFVHTISTCHEVEEVKIRRYGDFSGSAEAWKAACDSLKTLPSLKELYLDRTVGSYQWLDSDAEPYPSIVGANSTVQKCEVYFDFSTSTEAAIVRVLVDAVLYNQALRDLMLEVRCGLCAIGEVSRYMKAPTNVLTRLLALNCSDEEVVQVADALRDNKQLRHLRVGRSARYSCGGGMGKIGEALRTNPVLEKLDVKGTEMRGEEIEALVGTLIPDPTFRLQPNTQLHLLAFSDNSIRNKEGMEQVATLLRSNTSLRCLRLDGVKILLKGYKDLTTVAQMMFSALQSNASLESLDLSTCDGIGGRWSSGGCIRGIAGKEGQGNRPEIGGGSAKDGARPSQFSRSSPVWRS